MNLLGWRLIGLLALSLGWLTACPRDAKPAAVQQPAAAPAAQPESLLVWCDPALTPALEALSAEFTAAAGLPVTLLPRSRGELLAAAQRSTKPELPDVVVYGDPQTRTVLVQAGWLDEATARTFAGDRLVLIQLQESKFTTPTLFDIYRRLFKGFGLLSQEAIEGYYGQQALVTEGVRERIKDKLKEFPTLEDLTAALRADEIQIALVLASEAGRIEGLKPFFVIGEDLHEDIRYQAALTVGTPRAKPGMAYLVLLGEDQAAQQKLAGFGLLDRETALAETK